MSSDDAPRPIPQRGMGEAGPSAEVGSEDEVYTVDVRRRRRDRARSSKAQDAEVRNTRAMDVRNTRAQDGGGDDSGGYDSGARDGGAQYDRSFDDDGGGPRRRRRFPAGRVVLLLVAAWLAFMIFTPLHAWNAVTKVDTTPAGTRPVETKGFNYLLVGSDSREGLTAAQKKELTTGSDAGRRTDSIILVHVPEGGGKPALISIPRDSYVPIPGHGSNKINASFAVGGPNLLVQTVEQVTDLHIDGYVEIGFAGFASVVDSVGGVDICVPFRMNDKKAGINLKKGCQVLNGKNALGYVRARYSDPRGDIGRAERQRQFLAAIMKKALTPSTVLVPTRYWSFSHAAAHGLIVGEDTSMRDASRVLLAMRAVSNGKGLSLVVPISNLNYQTNAGSSVKWDTVRAKALFTLLRNDTPLESPPEGTDGKPSG